MQGFLRRGVSLFSPSPPADRTRSGDDSKTASESTLFTKVDSSVDGEDCDRDCASCTVHYPAKFDVELTDKLYGNVKGWATHVLVATGKTDWVKDVADERGSVMEAIDKGGLEPNNGKLKLSASNIPVPDEYYHHELGSQPTTVLILPAFTFVHHVTSSLAPDLIKYFVNNSPTTTTPLLESNPATWSPQTEENTAHPDSSSPSEEDTSSQPAQTVDIHSVTPLRSRPCRHAAVILLCSQRTRDARCGQSAPLLRREFERHLRMRGLYRDQHDDRPGGVGIYFISHVGGHKYAANVMVYRRRDFEWFRNHQKNKGEDSVSDMDKNNKIDSGAENNEGSNVEEEEGAFQGIWLARVRPEECEGIIKYTVLQGKVVKPSTQLRGGFDRERGLVSW